MCDGFVPPTHNSWFDQAHAEGRRPGTTRTSHNPGWLRADAVASLRIGVLIIPRTLKLLREAVDVLLESTPKGLELFDVRRRILSLPHVHDIHDLHASQVATGLPVLTAHVVVDDSCFHDGPLGPMLDELQHCLDTDFDVEHSTIQFEAAAHADHDHKTHA